MSQHIKKCHCGNQFNFGDRMLIMLPCGDKICLKCFDENMHQQSKLICPYDDEVVKISQKFRDNIDEIRHQSTSTQIICEEHNQEAKLFCKQHHSFICPECLSDHQQHMGQLTLIKKHQIEDFFEKAFQKLMVLSNRLDKSCGIIQDYQKSQNNYSSTEFLGIVKDIYSLLQVACEDKNEIDSLEFMQAVNQGLLPNKMDTVEDEESSELEEVEPSESNNKTNIINNNNNNPVKIENLDNTENNENMEDTDNMDNIENTDNVEIKVEEEEEQEEDDLEENLFGFDKHTRKTFKITADDQYLIEEWLGINADLELLYRGSRDGSSTLTFHELCDNQGPTLIIAKSETESVFGGYASVSWKSPPMACWVADSKAFLFSLTNKSIHRVKSLKAREAIINSKNSVIAFGDQGNLFVGNDFDKGANSHTLYFGTHYEQPAGIEYDTDECESYLSGTTGPFVVKELEVYKVTFQ